MVGVIFVFVLGVVIISVEGEGGGDSFGIRLGN